MRSAVWYRDRHRGLLSQPGRTGPQGRPAGSHYRRFGWLAAITAEAPDPRVNEIAPRLSRRSPAGGCSRYTRHLGLGKATALGLAVLLHPGLDELIDHNRVHHWPPRVRDWPCSGARGSASEDAARRGAANRAVTPDWRR